MSVLLQSGQIPNNLDATGKLPKNEEYKGSDCEDESTDARFKHV